MCSSPCCALLCRAGCSRIKVFSKALYCLQSRPDGQVDHKPCSSIPEQCFQIEGSLTSGTRIMQADSTSGSSLCIGILLTPWPNGASLTADSVRMMPCSGVSGYVKWRQASPGGYVTIAHPDCAGSSPPRECYLGLCVRLPPLISMAALIDTRLDLRQYEAKSILQAGRASYTVEEFAPGEVDGT